MNDYAVIVEFGGERRYNMKSVLRAARNFHEATVFVLQSKGWEGDPGNIEYHGIGRGVHYFDAEDMSGYVIVRRSHR